MASKSGLGALKAQATLTELKSLFPTVTTGGAVKIPLGVSSATGSSVSSASASGGFLPILSSTSVKPSRSRTFKSPSRK